MMTSAQYLTLEGFLSSSSPPTILLPRTQALRLVQLCELAEMTPSSRFLDFIIQNNDTDTEPSSSSSAKYYFNVNRNPHTLVTQMALLLYLGEYTHAQHLWSRSRRGAAHEEEGGGGANNSVAVDKDDDYAQLEKMWNAAQYICLWNTGGSHYSQPFNNTASSSGFIPSSTAESDTGITNMQVENSDDELFSKEQKRDDDDGEAVCTSNGNSFPPSPLPFSTLALRALQSCQTTKMEPLTTYAAQLTGVFRSRVNRRLHKYVEKLNVGEFCLRMNLECVSNDVAEVGEDGEVWKAYGWKKGKGGYLVSDDDGLACDDFSVEEEDNEMSKRGKDDNCIENLTNIVMFLEEKLNA
jgi:hypothetical protein